MTDAPDSAGASRGTSTSRTSLGVTLLLAVWIASGLALNAVLAARFGAGEVMDAYLAATTLPTLIAIVLQGSLPLTVVPLVVELETRGDAAAARRFAASGLRWTVAILGAIAAVFALAAQPSLRLLAPGLAPGTRELAADLARALAPSILLQGVAVYLQTLHYARDRFLLPSAAPLASNATTLAVVLALAPRFGIASAAWGVTVGAFAQCALLVRLPVAGVSLRRASWNDPSVARIARLLWPILLGSVFYRGNQVVERLVASRGPASSISYLGYASKIVGILVLLLTQAITLVALRQFSEQAARRDAPALRDSLGRALRWIFFTATPASLFLGCLAAPAIRLLFERREFVPADTRETARAVLAYLGVVYGASIATPLSRVLYAFQRTGTAAAIGVAGGAVHLVLSVALFEIVGWRGPAFAFSASQLFAAGALAFAARRLVGSLGAADLARAALRCLLAAIPAALLARWAADLLEPAAAGALGRAAAFAAASASGVVAYFGLARLLRIDEARECMSLVRGLLPAKRR